jgi:cobalt/nickel transport system permease protein
MPDLLRTKYNLRLFDELPRRSSASGGPHPIIQLATAIIFILATVSFGAKEITGLLPLVLYPSILFILNEIPVKPILSRVALALPFILVIGIWNPFFDRQPVMIGPLTLAEGWLAFISVFIKGTLTITTTLLLISSCGLAKLAKSLRILKIPRFLVLQLLLTYRYLTVLLDEAERTITAYSLRAPGQKGIRHNAWGSLLGQLFLRTYDRAERIYQAMCLRGFDGDYPDEPMAQVKSSDIFYGLLWTIYFLLIRLVDIPQLLGGIL